MKRTNALNRHLGVAIALLSLFFLCQSCLEDITGQWPVLQEELVGDYLDSHPELFSEFNGMLTASGTMGLLKAYGTYTVFAPTNEAIERYYQYMSEDKGEIITSYEQLPPSDIRTFCYNHIIKGNSLKVKDMHTGLLGPRTMSGRFYSISSADSALVINDYCPIVARDISLHNGIIHVLSEAFRPAYGAIAESFEKDSIRFSIYVKALKEIGMYKLMNESRFEDETYVYTTGPDVYQQHLQPYPTSRFFGFTILAVSDADLANYVDVAAGLPNGINSLADLEKLARYHYGIAFNHDADDITDKKNPKHYLNRFISYHCFNRNLYSSRFVKDYSTYNQFPEFPMPEYIETMMENTIVEVLLDKQGTTIGPDLAGNPNSAYGVFNNDDPAQRALLTQLKDLPAGGAVNGYYHGITRPIMYTKPLEDALSLKRLRMDVASFLPELTNNNIRGSAHMYGGGLFIHPDYFDNIIADNVFVMDYIFLNNYQDDELGIFGMPRFTLKTCPIPAGTYEVRITSRSHEYLQFYLDSIPCGVPVRPEDDLNKSGFVKPGTDKNDPEGYENDKFMRNHGYMKGPVCYGNLFSKETTRDIGGIRKILGTYTFNKTENHFFTVIVLTMVNEKREQTEFFLDYIEFCPVSLLDKEGRD